MKKGVKYINKKFKKELKDYFKRIISFKTSPYAIAGGFAIGSFIALLPTFGLAYFIGFGILLLAPRLNKFSLFLGIAFWNPIFLAPIYGYSYRLGNFIVGDLTGYTFKFAINSDLVGVLSRFFLGNFILAFTISSLSYVVLLLIFKYRNGGNSS